MCLDCWSQFNLLPTCPFICCSICVQYIIIIYCCGCNIMPYFIIYHRAYAVVWQANITSNYITYQKHIYFVFLFACLCAQFVSGSTKQFVVSKTHWYRQHFCAFVQKLKTIKILAVKAEPIMQTNNANQTQTKSLLCNNTMCVSSSVFICVCIFGWSDVGYYNAMATCLLFNPATCLNIHKSKCRPNGVKWFWQSDFM